MFKLHVIPEQRRERPGAPQQNIIRRHVEPRGVKQHGYKCGVRWKKRHVNLRAARKGNNDKATFSSTVKSNSHPPPYLKLVLGPQMRLRLAAEDGRISHAAVLGLHVDLGPDATGESACRTPLHLLPQREVLFHRPDHVYTRKNMTPRDKTNSVI